MNERDVHDLYSLASGSYLHARRPLLSADGPPPPPSSAALPMGSHLGRSAMYPFVPCAGNMSKQLPRSMPKFHRCSQAKAVSVLRNQYPPNGTGISFESVHPPVWQSNLVKAPLEDTAGHRCLQSDRRRRGAYFAHCTDVRRTSTFRLMAFKAFKFHICGCGMAANYPLTECELVRRHGRARPPVIAASGSAGDAVVVGCSTGARPSVTALLWQNWCEHPGSVGTTAGAVKRAQKAGARVLQRHARNRSKNDPHARQSES